MKILRLNTLFSPLPIILGSILIHFLLKESNWYFIYSNNVILVFSVNFSKHRQIFEVTRLHHHLLLHRVSLLFFTSNKLMINLVRVKILKKVLINFLLIILFMGFILSYGKNSDEKFLLEKNSYKKFLLNPHFLRFIFFQDLEEPPLKPSHFFLTINSYEELLFLTTTLKGSYSGAQFHPTKRRKKFPKKKKTSLVIHHKCPNLIQPRKT